MEKKKTLLILALVLALLIAGASVLYNRLGEHFVPEQLAVAETEPATEPTAATEPAATEVPEQTDAPPVRIPAPDFTVYDTEGNPVKLSDYFGKPIVLNFWASWCGPCQREMPGFNEKYQELEGEVQFLMINMTDGNRETVLTAAAFIEEMGYTFPVFFDITSEAAYIYGAYSLPVTYFIDADGNAVAQVYGAIGVDTLQVGIDMIS